MLGIALALASSVAWGTSDFLGGLRSRRMSALTVLLVSQPVGLVLALAFALAVGGDALSLRDAAIAAGAGATVVMALGAFYRAMALGSVTVVATIGALGVLVPVAAGLVQGDRPGGVQAIGAVAGIAGVVLVAREPDPEWRAASKVAVGSKPAAPAPSGRWGLASSLARRPGLLAALAALGFGTFFLGLDLSSGPQPAWTIVAARTGGVAALLVAAAFVRPSMRIESALLPSLVAIGFFDVLANSLFAVATNHGLLSLVAVAGSLYSAVTVLLARFVLGERLAVSQQAGVVIALAGVALIAAGS
jgi:drug/metabolite transporter (DMT)-like permease